MNQFTNEVKNSMNKELYFSLNSMLDDFGRVFFLDNKIYRAIIHDKIEYCQTLLASQLFRKLDEKGFVPHTSVSSLKFEGHELVLEHEKLLEIHQHEWSFDMLKSASLMVFELNKICNQYGYELKDAHNLNICFRGTEPVYVDIGSIIPNPNSSANYWSAYEEYLGAFIMPLLFWSKGYIYLVRKLLESNFNRMFTIPSQTFSSSGLLELINRDAWRYNFYVRGKKLLSTQNYSTLLSFAERASGKFFRDVLNRQTKLFQYPKEEGFTTLAQYLPYTELENNLNQMNSSNAYSEWKGYHTKFYVEDGQINYSSRFERLADIIQHTKDIKTVIDLAGNEGLFCRLLSERLELKRIILTDYDENAVNTAFLNFKNAGKENVHVGLLNFMFTKDLKGTADRFKSDLVLALAITHHLVLTTKYSVAAIFERLQLFSNKYVMVEFMPLGLWAKGNETYPELPTFYNVDWFRTEFKNYFSIIMEERLEENRILFFGSIKKAIDYNV